MASTDRKVQCWKESNRIILTWTDLVKSETWLRLWMPMTQNRSVWGTSGEAYLHQWACLDYMMRRHGDCERALVRWTIQLLA